MSESDGIDDLVWSRQGGVWKAQVEPKGPGDAAMILVWKDETVEGYAYDILVGGTLMFRGCCVSLDGCMRDAKRDVEFVLARRAMVLLASSVPRP